MKRILIFTITMMAVTLFQGCSNLTQETIIVGVTPNFAPLASEKDGKIIGLEVDLMNLVCEKTGRKAVYKVYPLTELLTALNKKEIDIAIGGLTITSKREEYVSFTAPIIKAGQMQIAKRERYALLSDINRMPYKDDLRLGVEAKTTGDEYVTKMFQPNQIKRYNSVGAAIRALKRNKIDLVIHDAPTSWACKDPELAPAFRALTEEYYGWAFRKEDMERFADISITINKYRNTREFFTIMRRWVPSRTVITTGKQ